MQRSVSDVSINTDKTTNIDRVKLAREIGRIEEKQQGSNILLEKESERIGNDLWRQLKRVSIPIFDGDKRQYGNWKSAFTVCIDHVLATAEYKLLQLRQYIHGDALKSIEEHGDSEYAYQAAKERLERKNGGQRRKILLHIEELENFKPKEIEKSEDLLDIAVTNLKEAKREDELGNGTFYSKLPERMVVQYHRWIFEHKKDENIETFRSFIIQEAEFQMATS